MFIQPGLHAFPDQPLRDLANGWLILAIVAHEDIKGFGFGDFRVHTDDILYLKRNMTQSKTRE